MLYKLSSIFIIILASCTSMQPDIQVSCEMDKLSNYILKWDIYPIQEGTVKIYTSNNPEKFNLEKDPIAEVNIADGAAKAFPLYGLERQYFLLRFNNKIDRIVGTRSQNLCGVQNFRDLGGYRTPDNKYIKWGMVYRSGKLDNIEPSNAKRLRSFNVKTLFDFRSPEEFIFPAKDINLRNVSNLPIPVTQKYLFLEKIENGELRRGDAIITMQDMYISLIINGTESLKSMFNQLLVAENYPVIITDEYGKDVTGLATALLLYALDIPEQTIMDDYLLTNAYFDKTQINYHNIYDYPAPVQEAITSILSADERYLNICLATIRKEHGSVDKYLEKEIGLSSLKKRKLQQILLNQ